RAGRTLDALHALEALKAGIAFVALVAFVPFLAWVAFRASNAPMHRGFGLLSGLGDAGASNSHDPHGFADVGDTRVDDIGIVVAGVGEGGRRNSQPEAGNQEQS